MNKPLILVVEDDPSVRNLITTTWKTKPCRRGQTVTGSGAGRTFRFGSPSIYNGHFSRKLGTAGEKISENLSTLLSESASGFVPMLCPFTLQRTKICRLLSIAVRKNSSVLAAGAGFSSGDFQNLARR